MLVFALIILFGCIYSPPIPPVYAEEECYAQILAEHVYFYRQPINDESTSNIYFELPKTYFVKLLDISDNGYYLAEYRNITGYVKKDSVRAISGTPSTPYLKNITFRVYADYSRDMRSYPSIDNNLSERITYIPLYSKNVEYISKISGQELVLNRTNVWYYCKYTTDTDYYGYIYSDFCDEMPAIPENKEKFEYIDNPTFELTPESQQSILDTKILGIIIAIMSAPALIFVFLIIRGKHVFNYHKSNKEVIDY